MATAYRMTGDYGRCRELVTRARDAAERCGDPSARCAAYAGLAMLAATEGDRAGLDGIASPPSTQPRAGATYRRSCGSGCTGPSTCGAGADERGAPGGGDCPAA